MPSVTHSDSSAFSSTSKKRRRDNEDEVQMSFSTSQLNHESHNLLSTINNNERLIPSPFHSIPRKVVPLSVNKRFRFLSEDEQASSPTTQPHHDHHAHPHTHHHHHHHQQSSFSHAHPTPPLSPQVHDSPYARPSTASRANSAPSLSPCHICHRKPTKKSDLDSFADCMGCGQRTCFVCIRACPGWLPTAADEASSGDDDGEHSTSFVMRDVDDDEGIEDRGDGTKAPEPSRAKTGAHTAGGGGRGWSGRGHREVICSGCCVERGSEGDVVCLGCLSGLEGA
ncbi:hypothetical protein F4810DRAFT_487147 [Camillea tinctor]|nr:hypothetical protein F4810DRAFT_487147 [Camillea tinctor]